MATLYLLASSPVAAEYRVVSLSDDGDVRVAGMAASSTAAISAVVSAATVTADLAACKNSLGSFAILGFDGPPNSIQIFKLTQTVAGVLGFSNSSSPPFTETIEIPVPLDSTGNGQSAPFYLKGLEPGQTVVSICNDQQQCPWNQVSSIVVKVDSVEWEAVNSPLDTNPNAGGGLRMFPDKDSLADNADKTAVTVKVTISSEFAGKPVYLKAFEVDDPSSDNTVVDRDGAGAIDNRGTTPDLNSVTGFSDATGITDSSGVARMTFHVSKQPGDNFRIAGTCLMPDRDGFTASGVGVKDASGQSLPTDVAKITPLLTVWRRVHVEMDSMGAVAGNQVTGSIRRARPDTANNRTEITVRQRLDVGRFKGGLMTIAGVGAGTVIDNTRSAVTIHGIVASSTVAGQSYVLVDDDDFNDDDVGSLDGDDAENVTAPDTSLVQDSDNPSQNVFAPAYVRPTYDIGDNNDLVPFVLNVAEDTSAAKIATYDFDNVATEASQDFWTVYLLGAYQYTTDYDADGPATEVDIIGGAVDAINGRGASVFNEVLRPSEIGNQPVINKAQTAAHEIGHLFNGRHEDNGLMGNLSTSFTDITLDKIRRVMYP
jgi:hypothetical protein